MRDAVELTTGRRVPASSMRMDSLPSSNAPTLDKPMPTVSIVGSSGSTGPSGRWEHDASELDRYSDDRHGRHSDGRDRRAAPSKMRDSTSRHTPYSPGRREREKRPLQDRLGPPTLRDRLGPRKGSERGPGRASSPPPMHFVIDNSGEESTKKERCTFWPNCTRGDECHFVHPRTMCNFGADCDRQGCIYIHPKDLALKAPAPSVPSLAAVPCKFGLGCLKLECPFSHPPGRKVGLGTVPDTSNTSQAVPTPLNGSPTMMCRYDPGCLNPACSYEHSVPKMPLVGGPSFTFGSSSTPFTKTPTIPAFSKGPDPQALSSIQCKFDPLCTRKGCLYKHGGKNETLPQSIKFERDPTLGPAQGPGSFKNRSLVLNNGIKQQSIQETQQHISDRSFAVPDTETERVGMDVDE